MLKNRFDKTMKAGVAGVWIALAMSGCVNVAQQGEQASPAATGAPVASAATATSASDAAAAASLQAAATAAASTAKLKAAQPLVYRVRRGDTLNQIAQRNHCKVGNLLAWNGLKPSTRLKKGRVLHVASLEAAKEASDAAAAATAAQAAADQAAAKAAVSAKLAAAAAATNPATNASTAASAASSSNAASIAPSGAPAPNPAQARQVDAEVSRHANHVTLVWPAQGTIVEGFQAGATRGIEIGGQPGDPVRAAADGKVMYAGTGLNEYGSLIIIQHNKDFLTAYSHNRRLLVKTGDIVRQGQEIAEMGDEKNTRVSVLFEVRRDGKPVDPMPYLPAKQS